MELGFTIIHLRPSNLSSGDIAQRGSPPLKKAISAKSAGKVMASVIWYVEEILLFDYLLKDKQ